MPPDFEKKNSIFYFGWKTLAKQNSFEDERVRELLDY